MEYVLLLMFFVTAPYNAPAKKMAVTPPSTIIEAMKKKDEKHIWAFQESKMITFATHEQCRLNGAAILGEILPVATMTVRGWCVCRAPADGVCPPPAFGKYDPSVQKLLQNILGARIQEKQNGPASFESIDSPYNDSAGPVRQ